MDETRDARCVVCGGDLPRTELRPMSGLSPAIAAGVREACPDAGPDDLICRADRARFRRRHVEALLEQEHGELTDLDREVLASLEAGATVTAAVDVFAGRRSFGERCADAVAAFGGSWTFILIFCAVLAIWIAVNVTGLFGVFDPYPFILLNLALSCIAAMQAPVIMMSQRRQEQTDRLRAENDYKINLKAELEIRHLHEKLDHQLARQWERLVEIQRVQIEMMEEVIDDTRRA